MNKVDDCINIHFFERHIEYGSKVYYCILIYQGSLHSRLRSYRFMLSTRLGRLQPDILSKIMNYGDMTFIFYIGCVD